MQPVQRRHHPDRHRRWLPLAGAALLLCLAVLLWLRLRAPEPAEVPEPEASGYGELAAHDPSEVASVTVAGRDGESWTALRQGDTLVLADDPDFLISPQKAEELLEAAAVVAYQRVLAEDPADYLPHLADLGLETPWRADIAYTDGTALRLRIGDRNDHGDSFTYLLAEGDDRLYAMDNGTAEILCRERALLHQVTQPVIHKARIDRVAFLDGAGEYTARWILTGEITAGDAEDHWLMTRPVRYPADGEQINLLKASLANLRLGAYVGEATPENRAKYGLTNPRFTLVVHQAEGDVSAAAEDGGLTAEHWPESELRLEVGDERSEVTDYVALDGQICLTSRFSLSALTELDPRDTLTRYVAPMPLGNLAALTVRRGEERTEWRVTRTERVLENNGLAADASGNVLYDLSVTRNGEEASWSAFEAAYQRLLLVTVSGPLPEGWQAAGEPTEEFVFESVTGETRTVTLTPWDALHDAVAVDGAAVFYLIRGGMEFDP